MSNIVIRVDNLSKHYRLGTIGGATLREDAQRWWAKVCGRPDPLAPLHPHGKTSARDIWALRDVSFEVRQGEVLGIVGRNGAGKSTLLKVLSRTTAPTKGQALVRGRIGSLLEVGTGFHPELTGRENIYLNGSILGMRKAEIDRKLDEIIDFSGVEQFIDTPVKRYSSGMYVRLAFAVAAHLDPEILVVDEVLAVGDIQFQKKCIGKMQDVAVHGRTVLIVSHNLQVMGSLCTNGLLFESGQITYSGKIYDAIERYHSLISRAEVGNNIATQSGKNRRGDGKARFRKIISKNEDGATTSMFRMGESIIYDMTLEANSRLDELYLQICLKSSTSAEVITSFRFAVSESTVPAGQIFRFVVRIPSPKLRPGYYPLYFWLGDCLTEAYDVVDDMTLPLTIQQNPDEPDKDFFATSPIGIFSHPSEVVVSSVISHKSAIPLRP